MAWLDQLYRLTIAGHSIGVYGLRRVNVATHSVHQQRSSTLHQGM